MRDPFGGPYVATDCVLCHGPISVGAEEKHGRGYAHKACVHLKKWRAEQAKIARGDEPVVQSR